MTRLLRGHVFHVPRDPFVHQDALQVVQDGALAIRDGAIAEVGSYAELRQTHPGAEVHGDAGDLLVPGFVDGHVHFPQIPVIGAMGLRLLEWLQARTLPEEATLADADHARTRARSFLRLLARNGTTTALVFGAHFEAAMDAFFAEVEGSGLRIAAGLVVSDRELRPELHTTPEDAVEASLRLIDRWHGHGRIRYAVTPRFSLSCSDALLAACGEAFGSRSDLLFTSHVNETLAEIETVTRLFPDAGDYLETYERHGLIGPRSVLAHNVHPTDAELDRLADASASVCHCPSSNMFIGSGLFPLRRHLDRGVHVCLGSDVGGGTGLSVMKEGLMAYQGQMLQDDGMALTPARLLWLATRAGAQALGLEDQVGDLTPDRRADVVQLRAAAGSTLDEVIRHAPDAPAVLAAMFTLAREEAVAGTWVDGVRVYDAGVS